MFCNLLKVMSVFTLITSSFAYFDNYYLKGDCKTLYNYIKNVKKDQDYYFEYEGCIANDDNTLKEM